MVVVNICRTTTVALTYLDSTLLSIDRENDEAFRGDKDGLQSLGVDTATKKALSYVSE